MQAELLPCYTYNDYAQWEGAWEVIGGIPWSMRSRFEPRHQLIAGGLLSELRNALKDCSGCCVYAPIDYVPNHNTVFNPDALVVCGDIAKPFLDFTPSLVAEVVSNETNEKDRCLKYSLYESEGIPYYLLVDMDGGDVEVHQLTEGRYERQAMNPLEPFEFIIGDCRFTVRFSDIWDDE